MTVKKKSSKSKTAVKKTKHEPRSASHSTDDNILGMFAHLLGLFTGFIGPLVLFLLKNTEHGSLARENAKHALNFQISLMIYFFVSGILIFVLIGILLMFVLGVFALVVQIVAAIRAYEGKIYQYPLEIQFIK